MTASIDLCSAWRRIGEAPAATFDGITRHLALGEWEMSGAVDAVELASGYTIDDIDTIRVVDDGLIIFAGQLAPVDAGDYGGLQITYNAEGERFVMRGPDVWSVLTLRVAYPTPSTEPPWADGHDTRSGVASTVAAAYLEHNLGSSALPARQVTASIVDGFAGTTGTWTARLQRLDALVARICADGGITCHPSVGFDGGLRVALVAAGNRSNRTVLSDQGDLVSIKRQVVPASTSYVIAGGQGELSSRTFAAIGGGFGLERRETFVDARNLASATEVAQRAATALAEAAGGLTVSAVLSDAATQRADMRYLTDYEVGDVVALEINGVRHQTPITAVTISISPERQIVRPAFGPVGSDALRALLRSVSDLESINRDTTA